MIGKNILTVIMLVLLQGALQGQDALFSQLQNSRNLLNPATLSIQDASLEIGLNYREQGSSVTSGRAIRTFQVLANYAHELFKADQISYGISILNDEGGQGHIGRNMAHLHLAYQKKLTGGYSNIGEHFLGFGTSFGGGQRSVGGSKFWFGNQFNEEYNFIEESKDPNEDVLLLNSTARTNLISDISAGISWYANFNDGFSASAGGSAFHLNQANISLIEGGNEEEKIRYLIHGAVRKTMSDLVTLMPRVQYIKHGVSSQVIFGSEVTTNNNDDSEFVVRIGAFGRAVTNNENFGMESIILTLNAQYNEFRFGFGYDLTISSLAKYNNGRGAWEFKLGYAFDHKEQSVFSRSSSRFRM